MTDEEWNQSSARSLGVFLAGEGIEEYDERGRAITDGDAIILINSHYESLPFVIPYIGLPDGWHVAIDTSTEEPAAGESVALSAGDKFDLKGRSLALLLRN